jgi:hypothetical protein
MARHCLDERAVSPEDVIVLERRWLIEDVVGRHAHSSNVRVVR